MIAGVLHFSFTVTDIHETHRRLADHRVAFRSEPVEITAGANRGGFACYFSDPDGATLELLQHSPSRLLEFEAGTLG